MKITMCDVCKAAFDVPMGYAELRDGEGLSLSVCLSHTDSEGRGGKLADICPACTEAAAAAVNARVV